LPLHPQHLRSKHFPYTTLFRSTLGDKKSYKAHVLAKDPRNDMALIKIEAGGKLPALKLGDSDSLIVGQKVLAIGNPFGIFGGTRSEEHTSELQSLRHLVCRLLL